MDFKFHFGRCFLIFGQMNIRLRANLNFSASLKFLAENQLWHVREINLKIVATYILIYF